MMTSMKQQYTFEVSTTGYDTYPNDFKCWVVVTDHKTNTTFRRRGYGKYIGNFSPIWISINGQRKQLTEFANESYE